MVVTNRINLKLADKIVFNEVFTLNMGANIELSDDKTKLTIKPIKCLDEFAGDGAITVAKLICERLRGKGVYPCRNNSTLELTLRHRKFEVTSLNGSFLLSVVDTDVVAVMESNEGE